MKLTFGAIVYLPKMNQSAAFTISGQEVITYEDPQMRMWIAEGISHEKKRAR